MIPNITIEDLLGREPVIIDANEISQFLKNKRVLITGAAGSIGSELVKQILLFNPEQVILFDHNENGLFFLEKELKLSFPTVNIIVRLGSICNLSRVQTVFKETSPHVVYHAAANKHVPLSEENVSETIHNNIVGTHVVASVAGNMGSEAFVMISTDKAVNPTSIMGATKRVAELYVQWVTKLFKTRFITVRFGNVLGSNGSVVPIFKSQIAAGGPVTVTHPDMTRFFMTIPEASKLVLQASAFGAGGDIFILDMGEPVKIIDLAKRLIILSGLEPDVDIAIEFSGIRSGEKLYEELTLNNETSHSTSHSKIRRITTVPIDENIKYKIYCLENLPANTTRDILKAELKAIIPEANLD